MVEQQLANCWGSINGNASQFLALGHYDSGQGPQFNMTALAMRSAGVVNAVSQLHGEVTRAMFAPLWPDLPAEQRPVGAITNGVHVPTWVSRTMGRLYERHLGPLWRDLYEDPAAWRRVLEIPDEELWAARSELRAYLVHFARDRARQRWTQELVPAGRILSAGVMLESTALTIGFARRFTGYKRPDLVFRDPDRLARLLNAPGRPVQLVFAGKAHPADEAGKHHLQTVLRHALDPRFAGRIAFVEDYDLHVAQYLVQGCDVWLNTPRKPMEASGTSGMKAAMNGGLHMSVGDGWWAEGYTGGNGWQIGPGSHDPADVDAADAESIYQLLEQQVVPTFYERDARGLPHRWLAMVKQAMLTITPQFSARRMFKDYVSKAYAPAIRHSAADRVQPL
jgi:starch phosphorylase